jgi:hypothetical protein
MDSLKVLDPEGPIREADIGRAASAGPVARSNLAGAMSPVQRATAMSPVQRATARATGRGACDWAATSIRHQIV